MNNEVILYKTEFTTSGAIQPYFKTVEGRDNYFNSCPHISSRLNNPNLVLEKSLSISIQVPFDITVIEDYNFVVFTYNSKTYYAYIVDYEMVSFGFSRLLCHRCVLAEKINFLQYYKNLQVDSVTTKRISNMSNFYIPDEFRTKRRIKNALVAPERILINRAKQKLSQAHPSFTLDENLIFLPCFIINAVNESGLGYSNIGNQPTLYNTYIIPLISNAAHKYATFSFQSGTVEILDNINDYKEILAPLTPYIINVSVIFIPFFKINNTNSQYFVPYFDTVQNENKYYRFMSDSVKYETKYNFKLYIQLIENYDINNFQLLFTELNIYLFDFSSPLNLKIKEYTNKNNHCKISLALQYKFTVDGFYLITEVINDINETMQPAFKTNKKFSTAFSANTTLVVDSSEDFKAKNKYFDAITNQQIYYEAAMGSLQATENISIGGTQIIQGLGGFAGLGIDSAMRFGKTFSNAGSFGASGGSFGLGVGNIIRGIFGALQMGVKIQNIKKMRELESKTQSSQPAKFSPSSGSIVLESIMENAPFKIETISPITEDYEIMIKDIKTNGCKCNLFFDNGNDFLTWWEDYRTDYLVFSGVGMCSSEMNNDFIDAFNTLIEIRPYFKIID